MLRSKRLNNIILERTIEYSTYPVSKFHGKKVNPMVAFRTHTKISRKDALTWPAHMLPKFVTCLSNSTSLLAVIHPCKYQAGWSFWCPDRNVDFSAYNRAQDNHLPKATRLGLSSTSSNALSVLIIPAFDLI